MTPAPDGRTLLIITYHFPPSAASGAHRILGFARHLPSFGWNVAVVAPPTLPWEPSDRARLAALPEETTVLYEPYQEQALTKPIRKYAPYGYWLMSRWQGIRRACQRVRPQVVMTSGPPHVVHVAALARGRGTPWVADFRDPWATGDEQLVKKGRIARIAERSVLRRADRIIWNTPAVLEHMQTAFPEAADRMTCIPNGFDPDVFPARTSVVSPGVRRILHTGMIYFGRDPRPLLDALARLQQGGATVRTDFLGFKPGFTVDIEAEAQRRGLADAVSVAGHVPHAVALQRMVDADVLLLLDTPGRRLGVPAKLYEYIGAGRPILALCEQDSDTARTLSQSGAVHRVAAPDDAAAIAQAIAELLPLADAHDGSRDGRTGPFTRRGAAEKLAALLDEIGAPERNLQPRS